MGEPLFKLERCSNNFRMDFFIFIEAFLLKNGQTRADLLQYHHAVTAVLAQILAEARLLLTDTSRDKEFDFVIIAVKSSWRVKLNQCNN